MQEIRPRLTQRVQTSRLEGASNSSGCMWPRSDPPTNKRWTAIARDKLKGWLRARKLETTKRADGKKAWKLIVIGRVLIYYAYRIKQKNRTATWEGG